MQECNTRGRPEEDVQAAYGVTWGATLRCSHALLRCRKTAACRPGQPRSPGDAVELARPDCAPWLRNGWSTAAHVMGDTARACSKFTWRLHRGKVPWPPGAQRQSMHFTTEPGRQPRQKWTSGCRRHWRARCRGQLQPSTPAAPRSVCLVLRVAASDHSPPSAHTASRRPQMRHWPPSAPLSELRRKQDKHRAQPCGHGEPRAASWSPPGLPHDGWHDTKPALPLMSLWRSGKRVGPSAVAHAKQSADRGLA